MPRVTQRHNRHDGDDEIDRARSRHEAEPLNQDSPQREDAEGNRQILAQLRVRLQDVLGRRAQRVPDAVGLHVASEVRTSGRKRAKDRQGQGGVGKPDASRSGARDEIDQHGDDQQPDREMIDDGMQMPGLEKFHHRVHRCSLDWTGSEYAQAPNPGNCAPRCAVCAVYRKASGRAQICGTRARKSTGRRIHEVSAPARLRCESQFYLSSISPLDLADGVLSGRGIAISRSRISMSLHARCVSK